MKSMRQLRDEVWPFLSGATEKEIENQVERLSLEHLNYLVECESDPHFFHVKKLAPKIKSIRDIRANEQSERDRKEKRRDTNLALGIAALSVFLGIVYFIFKK